MLIEEKDENGFSVWREKNKEELFLDNFPYSNSKCSTSNMEAGQKGVSVSSDQCLAANNDDVGVCEHKQNALEKCSAPLPLNEDYRFIENIEELLNGIRDFTEGQLEIVDSSGNLAEFLQDVALATDLDKDEDPNIDRVALMTIHLAKGLEFPYVFIVGLEEDLFPSAMSLNTRSELEEERRLFYVAMTRAKERAFLSYTLSRYRWGKLIDSEPSRFIEEIDSQYVDHIKPKDDYSFKPLIKASIFDNPSEVKKDFKVKERTISSPTFSQLKKLRKIDNNQPLQVNQDVKGLAEGMMVEHARFGKGVIENIKGKGQDRKALISFKDFSSLPIIWIEYFSLVSSFAMAEPIDPEPPTIIIFLFIIISPYIKFYDKQKVLSSLIKLN